MAYTCASPCVTLPADYTIAIQYTSLYIAIHCYTSYTSYTVYIEYTFLYKYTSYTVYIAIHSAPPLIPYRAATIGYTQPDSYHRVLAGTKRARPDTNGLLDSKRLRPLALRSAQSPNAKAYAKHTPHTRHVCGITSRPHTHIT